MSFSTRVLALAAMAQMVSAQTTSTTSITQNATEIAAATALQVSMFNQDFYNYLFIVCASMVLGMLIWRITLEAIKYIRHLTCLNNETQRFYSIPADKWASFKKHILYAPIFSKRHNKEIALSRAINIGTLPTRFQLFLLIGYFATNIAFCAVSIRWSQPLATWTKELRNRTGILAVVNMIPLFIMAGRNNILIKWLNLSFDTFNLLHRWFGRIVVLETLAHVVAWAIAAVAKKGWSALFPSIWASQLYLWGFVATVAVVLMTIQGISMVRHAFYEIFKYLHIFLAIVVVIGIWFHLVIAGAPQLKLLYGVVAIWAGDHAVRLFKLLYRNRFGSRALVEALPGNAVRVTVDMPNPWRFKAGQHAYLYMPSVGLLTSHPFSVAWSHESEDLTDEKLAMNRQDILAMQKTSISFIIRERTGFTRTLFKKAEASVDGRFVTKCFAEGPYGGMHSMHSYGTVMLFAGGVGITHQVPHVRDLVAGYANGTVAARKIVLVWIIQSPEHLEWIRPWMTSILAMDKRREVLRIMLFVSRPRNTKEIHSPSATVQMFPGRPNIETLLDLEIEGQVGAMGVSVCGSGALSDDVRDACRKRQHVSNLDFVEESFTW